MHFLLSDALHHQQWPYLSVHIQMVPHRTELHTHWVDFLTSWYCKFIRGKLNNHPLQQRRSAKHNPVKLSTHEHRTSFQLFPQLKLPSLQSSHRTHRHKIWKRRFWQIFPPPWEVVEAWPCLSGQSRKITENPLGCGYLNGPHPPSSLTGAHIHHPSAHTPSQSLEHFP